MSNRHHQQLFAATAPTLELNATADQAASHQAFQQLQLNGSHFLSNNNSNNNNNNNKYPLSATADEQQRQMALLNLFSSLTSMANSQQSPLSNQQHLYQSPKQEQQQQQQQQQQVNVNMNGQQRINYCTICNKELCNKYFMKTHMLKMHGINLEMETSQNGSDDDNQEPNDQSQPEDCSLGSQQQMRNQHQDSGNWKKRKESTGSLDKLSASTTPASASKQPQTTSVMNGFAGNSMGGVICDICNKELCSKYFLKVHKQNTHGIATDTYHDSSPFAAIYPFAAVAAAGSLPGLGLPVGCAGAPFQPAVGLFECNTGQPAVCSQSPEVHEKLRPAKKIRLGQTGNIESKAANEPANGATAGQLESLYRLMLAQHQHQQPEDPIGAAVAASAAAAAAAMNPLSALMCFGGAQQAAGAFMSPAMIVEQILRNQHLFNQHHQKQPARSEQKPATKGRQNNPGTGCSNGDSPQTNPNKATSANPNKRYFSHYTEACPMCDRRFKSIKWLKTHMMNDHKHEIGAYMQSMMQYLYQSNRSQRQMAAAFEHHQPAAMFHQHQQQQQYSAHLQQNQLMSVLNQQQQQRQFDLATSRAAPFVDHTAQQQQQHYRQGDNFVLDARRTNNERREQELRANSLSPQLSGHEQPRRSTKKLTSYGSGSPPINNHTNNNNNSNHQARSSLILPIDEAHDLSANDAVTGSAAETEAEAASVSGRSESPLDCELSFELKDRNDARDTYLASPSPRSCSPGPILSRRHTGDGSPGGPIRN